MSSSDAQASSKAKKARWLPNSLRPSRRLRRLTRTSAFQGFVSWLLAGYIKLVFRTTRWTYHGVDELNSFLEHSGLGHAVLWHNRIAMMPVLPLIAPMKLTILISDHADGRIVGRTMNRFGIDCIGVSSKTSNAHVAKRTISAFRNGSNIGVTPDGPRGPAQVVPPMPVRLASMCRAPVALITYSVRRRIVFNSWDRFILPLPFNRGTISWRMAFDIPAKLTDAELADWQERIRTALIELTDAADRECGHAPLFPEGDSQPQ